MTGTSKMTAVGNLFSGTTGNTVAPGGAFIPPYTLTVASNTVLNTTTFKNCVGATLTAPPASSCPCNSALLLSLLSFEIVPHENNYQLSWILADDEKIVTKTTIEYSLDGVNFFQLFL
jgi:hypothetical protein